MKSIGILLPCYNEQDNIIPITEEIRRVFKKYLPEYQYNIVFIDNCSMDKTIENLRMVCAKYSEVKAILNAKNFSWSSCWHGIINTPGDCVISLPSDFQIPPVIIPELVEKWEEGSKIVCMIKSESKEKKSMWMIRQVYYKLSEKFSEGEILPNFTGALYDREFIELCINTGDPLMYSSLRAFICSHGYSIANVYYAQEKRKNGKSSNRFSDLCYIALRRFSEGSQMVPYISMMSGLIIMFCSLLAAAVYSICNVFLFKEPIINNVIILLSIFFMGAIQLVFIGVLGEYLMKIHGRLLNRPIVIEHERLNFEKE